MLRVNFIMHLAPTMLELTEFSNRSHCTAEPTHRIVSLGHDGAGRPPGLVEPSVLPA